MTLYLSCGACTASDPSKYKVKLLLQGISGEAITAIASHRQLTAGDGSAAHNCQPVGKGMHHCIRIVGRLQQRL